ncbi:YceI family protein [Prauserella cavernicola]|uniref:YceI family protein n=1 Tax=Prauserella cavernicola TaxID=2800127 RepID=A0A934V1J1_9PSEU|nr:YceI family protein [Prauserella cavernicola]MBK1783176.1 YceI family protein [Prauserella cavernicola]
MSDSAATGALPAHGDYRVDPEGSTISFVTRHLFGLAPVRGTFALGEGHIHVADPVSGSSARASIPATSFDTGNAARDSVVRSTQYLAADEHPHITFASTGVSETEGRWTLHGALTVRGQTRPLDVLVERADVGEGTVNLTATAEVDRYEFGITAQKGMTGRRLTLTLDLVAVRAA